jgi:hypothetical protein
MGAPIAAKKIQEMSAEELYQAAVKETDPDETVLRLAASTLKKHIRKQEQERPKK